ncbi:hypothetical protein WMY93_018092 [Mugilogobius chulae]|uniref:Uncharacterized protein n=1 Tax=Mugilogobius chulae TaxID=88201 RepID=A0AAW0NJ14_9GOBI
MSRRKQGKPQHLSKRDFSPAEPVSGAVVPSEELLDSGLSGHPPLGSVLSRLEPPPSRLDLPPPSHLPPRPLPNKTC